MFNKLSTLPSFVRLVMCLLISAGMHGGMVFYGWASRPVALHNGAAPVVVALLPADENAVFPQAVENKTLPAPMTETQKKKPIEKAVQAKPVEPIVEPPRITPPKPGHVPAPSAEVKTDESAMTTDLVCVEPQDNAAVAVAESSSETRAPGYGVTDDPVVATTVAHNPATQMTSDGAQGAPGDVLVEAVPDYRRNPLPEYPYIARQKRWEGVVWLLVDVTSKGRVAGLAVEQSCGHQVLDRAASRTVRSWEFTPAVRAGMPVESQVRIPVRFRLEGS